MQKSKQKTRISELEDAKQLINDSFDGLTSSSQGGNKILLLHPEAAMRHIQSYAVSMYRDAVSKLNPN